MADVFKFAEFFVETAGDEGDMTNLKLNKMLFFAQGVHLARTGKPLFDNPIEAWRLGPVVPEVYRKYSICQGNPIGATDADIDGVFSEAETETLFDVMREYGKYSASYLVNRTHKQGTPWSDTAINDCISLETMREYFRRNEIVSSFADTLKCTDIPVVTGRRDESGVLVLPCEEDEDWGEFDEV